MCNNNTISVLYRSNEMCGKCHTDQKILVISAWFLLIKCTFLLSQDNTEGSMPHYFSFLTVMAFHVFVRECVDVALLEVGIGGQFDSTNVVSSPIVCGLSSLDLDHTNLLGHTLQDIAWHKAGIFKVRNVQHFCCCCSCYILFSPSNKLEISLGVGLFIITLISITPHDCQVQ